MRKVDSSHNRSAVAGQCASPRLAASAGTVTWLMAPNSTHQWEWRSTAPAIYYVADSGNHRVRRVDSVSGNITTIAGDSTEECGGDGDAATAAHLNHPYACRRSIAPEIFTLRTATEKIRKEGIPGIINTVAENRGQGAG